MIIQKHPKGCGIACLATVLASSYDEVASQWPDNSWLEHGIYPDELIRFLWRKGYYVMRKYSQDSSEWPPKPFAPIHICEVVMKVSKQTHFIIMKKDGLLLDPLDGNQKSWDDFESLNRVEGISL